MAESIFDLSTDGEPDFASGAESAVFEVLRRLQAARPAGDSFGIIVAPSAYLPGRRRPLRPDLVILTNGKAAALEIDGHHHARRWAADRSRDRLLELGGLLFVDHLAAEDSLNEEEIAACLAHMLRRLERAA